jgi:monothiol glutaredoxin
MELRRRATGVVERGIRPPKVKVRLESVYSGSVILRSFVDKFFKAMTIKAYLKPQCGWSNGVRAIMSKHGLEYEDIDIINNRDNYAEMVQKSGQPLSPCVEIDGVMLADVSGEEVENYMLSNELINPTEATTDVATDKGCSDEEHAKMASDTIRFF